MPESTNQLSILGFAPNVSNRVAHLSSDHGKTRQVRQKKNQEYGVRGKWCGTNPKGRSGNRLRVPFTPSTHTVCGCTSNVFPRKWNPDAAAGRKPDASVRKQQFERMSTRVCVVMTGRLPVPRDWVVVTGKLHKMPFPAYAH